MTEISETDLANLLSKSTEAIKEFMVSHPELLYKGIPLVLILWMTYPLLLVTWSWLPWFWASYEIYKLLPPNSFKWAYELVRNENIYELIKNLAKTD